MRGSASKPQIGGAYIGVTRVRHRSRLRRGATLVEFALVAPMIFLLFIGIAAGAWYVFEVSAINNSARTAARFEVAAANFQSSSGLPDCDASPIVNAALVSPAKAAAGPFAGAITTSTLQNTAVDPSGTDVLGCTVTITVPFSPIESLLHIGPSSISSSFTAYLN